MYESLIPWEDLQAARTEYELDHPIPPTKAEILCEIVRENPMQMVKELAQGAERSRSWVRKTLKRAGLTLTKPPRKTRTKAGARRCRCGHTRANHCYAGTLHSPGGSAGWSPCATSHCLLFTCADGVMIGCNCREFTEAEAT